MAGVKDDMWWLQDARYLRLDGENRMSGALILPGDSSDPGAAVRKAYVDGLIATLSTLTPAQIAALIAAQALLTTAEIATAVAAYLPLAGGTMTGLLTLSGDPVGVLDATTRQYTDAADALRLLLAGGTMLGMLTLSGDPVGVLDATTRQYTDAADALRLLLAGGTMLGLLTLSGDPVGVLDAATKQYVDALPTGLSTYDAVVAAAGGDYTSVVAACAGEAAGAKIFVKSGTYIEVADVVMLAGQELIGENPHDTIIDFGAANFNIVSAAVDNVTVKNLTVQASIADYTIDLLGSYARIDNCRVIGTAAAFDGIRLTGAFSTIENTYFNGFTRAAAHCLEPGQYCSITANTFRGSARGIEGPASYCNLVNNVFTTITDRYVTLNQMSMATGNIFINTNAEIFISGDNILISGNYIGGSAGITWDGPQDQITITGNAFNGGKVDCDQVNAKNVTITGNTFYQGTGINMSGFDFVISGNNFFQGAFISLDAGSDHGVVTGNNLEGSTAATVLVDNGDANLAMNNAGVASISEKNFHKMKNTSGGALVAGDTVVLKAVAAGDEFTTTVNQGDDLVLGMLDEGIGNNASGSVQVEGKTVKLKVNGVINIGIGDLLGTFTAAGISMQAQAGDMAFAIALEAYAVADSLGVIDALLVSPRKV